MTVTPRLSWTTPGLPTEFLLHAQSLESGRDITLPLRITPSDSGTMRSLSPFVHVGGDDEPAIGRLARDPDGSWWGIALEKAAIVHISANWMVHQRFQAPAMAKKPLALVARSDGLYVLDGDTRSVWHYQGATVKDRLGAFDKPSDLAVASDGTMLVADQKSGGIVALAANGSRRMLVRASQADGGFSHLTRLCLTADGTLHALDAGAHQIVRFDRSQQLMAPLALAPADNAVDLVATPQGMAVLLATGEIRLVSESSQGVNAPVSQAATMAQLGTTSTPAAEPLGTPSGIQLDVDGSLLVCYEEHGAIARFSARGQWTGMRLRRLWSQHVMAADGQGRLAIVDPGERWLLLEASLPWLYITDSTGFCTRRLGGPFKQGGTFKDPELVAFSPDGAMVAIVDADTKQVQRFSSDAVQPRIFAGHGKGPGQFEAPAALALDDSGMTYVLDATQHLVTVFDAKGVLSYSFGHAPRADALEGLHLPHLLAVYPEGGAAFVYDEESTSVKQYALDPEHHRAQYVGSPVSKGTGNGSIQHLIGLGCDRLGLVYLVDSKRNDIQVVDTRTRPATLVVQIPFDTLGVRKVQSLCLAPDGQVFLPGDSIHGFCW